MQKIEALVKKYERLVPAGAYTLCYSIRAALTELAAEYEQQITELQAMAIKNGQQAVLLSERVKQLEDERVPEWRKLAESAEKHLTFWLDENECDCENGHICGKPKVRATRDGLRAMLAASPVKEGE